MDRDQYLPRRGQRIDGQQAQRGGTVDKHVVKILEHRLKRAAQPQLPGGGRDQLHLCPRKVDRGGHAEEVFDCRCGDGPLDRDLVHQDLVDRGRYAPAIHPYASRSVRLGIEVHQQHPLVLDCQPRPDVHGRRGLPHAPLLVSDGQDPRRPSRLCHRAPVTSAFYFSYYLRGFRLAIPGPLGNSADVVLTLLIISTSC